MHAARNGDSRRRVGRVGLVLGLALAWTAGGCGPDRTRAGDDGHEPDEGEGEPEGKGDGPGEGEGEGAEGEGEGAEGEGEGAEGEGAEGEGEGAEGEGEGAEGQGEGAEGEGEGAEGEGEGAEGEGEGAEGEGAEGEGEGAELQCPPPPPGLPELEQVRDGRWLRIPRFPSAALGNARELVIYLPEDYDQQPERRFDVLYMHDGQNLFFDGAAAFGTEWQVDEAVDGLVGAGIIAPLVVVGVANTGDRMGEYTPSWDASIGDGGRGEAYGRFLVEEVKPWVQANLRVACDPRRVGLAGSSLGGLISLYLLREYPDEFGRVGCVSSSLWWNDRQALGWAAELLAHWRPGARLWLDAGTAEGNDSGTEEGSWLDPEADGMGYMVDDSRELAERLLAGGLRFTQDLGYFEDLGARHEEAAWAGRLPAVLAFLFAAAPGPAAQELTLRSYVDPVETGRRVALAAEAWGPAPRVLTVPASQLRLGSEAPARASVTADGMLETHGAGAVGLWAEWQGLRAGATVQVVDAGALAVTLQFVVHVPVGTPAGDTIYLTGNLPELGGWAPRGLALAPLGDLTWGAELTVRRDTALEFKVSRGSWETVEKGPFGEELPNHELLAAQDGVVQLEVLSWADEW